jgi:hypothetical protein
MTIINGSDRQTFLGDYASTEGNSSPSLRSVSTRDRIASGIFFSLRSSAVHTFARAWKSIGNKPARAGHDWQRLLVRFQGIAVSAGRLAAFVCLKKICLGL